MNDDTSQQSAITEILSVMATIQTDFPTIYEHLNETSLFLSALHKDICLADYVQYLESLQLQTKAFQTIQ